MNLFDGSLLPTRLVVLVGFCLSGCSGAEERNRSKNLDTPAAPTNPDHNGDGAVNILVLGTNTSITGSGFSPDQIAIELSNIFSADNSFNVTVNSVGEDLHTTKPVTLGLGQNGAEYTYTHHRHSLAQYYYWPEGQTERWANLSNQGETIWDYVVIGADPYFTANLPGYYALGVNKVAAKIASGGAKPLLLMLWPKEATHERMIEHFDHVTHRVVSGAGVELEMVPAGRAWHALNEDQRDSANRHPSPHGAYLAAATIYAQITNQSAAVSDYSYDDALADAALKTVNEARGQSSTTRLEIPISPFSSCDIDEEVISYNHTGSSSERGILGGLNWVFDQAPQTLQNGGETPINFNYGRANSNFEPNKRYQVDPSRFDFSFGFPMQDNGNRGNESMLYGLDHRDSGTLNDTDVGVARFMIDQSETPHARAVPIRTLFAQLREAIPEQSAFRDAWHMHRDLDKASGAFMYTLLTGQCVVGEEPTDRDSGAWRTWTAHRIGYETAWTLMHLEAAPVCSLDP